MFAILDVSCDVQGRHRELAKVPGQAAGVWAAVAPGVRTPGSTLKLRVQYPGGLWLNDVGRRVAKTRDQHR
jgi:hypothetical protein